MPANAGIQPERHFWIPASAGMTRCVTPAKAGVQLGTRAWIPAFAGTTAVELKGVPTPLYLSRSGL
jgi:hypothetical protein